MAHILLGCPPQGHCFLDCPPPAPISHSLRVMLRHAPSLRCRPSPLSWCLPTLAVLCSILDTSPIKSPLEGRSTQGTTSGVGSPAGAGPQGLMGHAARWRGCCCAALWKEHATPSRELTHIAIDKHNLNLNCELQLLCRHTLYIHTSLLLKSTFFLRNITLNYLQL